VLVILGALLLIPVAYALVPNARTAATSTTPSASTRLPATNAAGLKPGSPQAVALTGVQAKTGLKYSTSCAGSTPCISLLGQSLGQGAAAVIFSTAKTAGRECAGYVVQSNGAWQLVNAVCGLPNQVSPLIGRDATVHVPGNCANARSAAGLSAGVLNCLYDGSSVHVDGGPTYADNLIWWHTDKGWIAHDFLVGP
jgi:hypothetical protein